MALPVLWLCLLTLDVFPPIMSSDLSLPNIYVGFEQMILHPGESVTLTCKAKGNPIPEIEWKLDEMEITMKANMKEESTLDIYNNAISELSINNIRTEDGGVFKCIAKNKAGQAVHKARIHVFGKIAVRPNVKVYATSEETVDIDCPYYGYPVKTFSWTKGRVTLPDNKRQRPYKNGTLSIINIQRRKDNGIYKCIVEGTDNTIASGDIEIIIMVRPKITPFSFQDEQIREGTRVQIQCVVSEGESPLEITWVKDGSPIPSDLGLTIRYLDEFSSILLINAIAPRHNGNYTCIASNMAGRAAHTAPLFVNVPPKIMPFAFQDDQFFRGMRAYIVCALSQGDLPIHFNWLKDSHPIPPSLGVITRNIDEHATSLSIESVSSVHTGNYTCVASNTAANSSHTAQLLVHGIIPRILPFKFRSNIIEGFPVRVTCVVDQGDLPIDFHWMKDGTSVHDFQGISTRTIDDHSSLLIIDNVATMHSGNYTCVASNTAATVNHTTLLVVHVPPKVVPFFFQEDHLLEGMLVRVTCVVSRGDLPLEIVWLKDDRSIRKELRVNTRNFDEYSSVLSIEPVTVNHSGNYTCVAKNHAGVASHTARLSVNVPPEWVTIPNDVTVNIDQWLMLNCQATGYPLPKITWERSIDKLSEGLENEQTFFPVETNENTKIFTNGSLNFVHVKKSDEGYYYCIASNDIGEPLSKAIMVTVNAAPVFKIKREEIPVKRGETVNILCKADGDGPIIYTWTVNNNSLDVWFNNQRYKLTNQIDEQTKESYSELTIFWVDKKDSVSFACRAENSLGIDEKYVQLLVQYPPEEPELRIVQIFNQSAQLQWNILFDGNSPILRYFLQSKKENEIWTDDARVMKIEKNENSRIISNLKPATVYTFRIRAENIIGNGSYSKPVIVKTEEIAPSGSPQNVQVESSDDATVLRVTWNPPEKTTTNGAIQGYNIGYKIEDSSEDYKFSRLEVPEDYTATLIYQLRNLQMYSQYEVVVQAYNSKGSGPSSEPVVAMTSEGVPNEPPENVRCSTLSSKSIYILWDPPRSEALNGILRGYKVLYKPSSEWYDVMQQFKIVHAPKLALQELEINTNYTFQVLAFTKVGDGKRSKAIRCKTFEDAPEAPVAVKVLPSSSESVIVSWKPSKRINTMINHFNVYYKQLEKGQEIDIETQNTEQFMKDALLQQSHSDALFLEVTGLKKNQKYAFWVTASSHLGESPTSSLVAQTVADSVVPSKVASFDDTIKIPWKKDILMPCKAVGVPAPKNKWTMWSKPLAENGHLIFRPDGALIITKATSEDSGNYTCTVYNEYGRDEVTYNVIVQVPPAAPKIDIISKSKSSIQLQWKSGPHGGDPIRGYLLHHKKGSDSWSTIEIRPEHRIYTLDSLPCGTLYQIYMEAFNSIGTGPSSEIISVETGGGGEIPSKEALIKEGSTFATIHLESWPSTGCPVEFFGIEYKATSSRKWTVVGSNIPPSQNRVVISDLTPASRYVLRLLIQTNGETSMHEYKFSTLTITGDAIPPEMNEDVQPVYIFHLDPWIFIPSVILLIVVIIASVVVCVVVKQRNGAIDHHPDMDMSLATNQMNAWIRSSRALSPEYGYSQRHSTLSSLGSKDPSPYATSRMIDCYPDSLPEPSLSNPFLQPGNSMTWKPAKSAPVQDFQKDFLHRSQPDCSEKAQLHEKSLETQHGIEKRFAIVDNISIGERPVDDYDPPPLLSHMVQNSFPKNDQYEENGRLERN